MADHEQTADTLQVQEESLPAPADEPVGYWCYQCSKAVTAEGTDSELSTGMFCTECQSGFIEAMATAQPDSHGVVPRTRRRRRVASQRMRFVALLDALERLYPQQLRQALQDFEEVTFSDSSEQEQEPSDWETPNGSGLIDQNIAAERSDVDEEGHPESIRSRVIDLDALRALSVERTSGEGAFEQDGHFQDGASREGHADVEHDGMMLEFEEWDSEEEGEWDEVDEEAAEDEEEAGDTGAENTGAEEEDNLHRYLQSFLESLGGQSEGVSLELPDFPFYVGNPGDYLDARGFDHFLQHLTENDNSRRGAPPAAKAVVNALPIIRIENSHLDDGVAVCAICKDVFRLGDSAKQLPCLHLYHDDCILPWLSSRNSCPMCRFELSTDDPEYEDQKQREIRLHQLYEPPSAAEEQLGGEEGYIPVQGQVASSPGSVETAVPLSSYTITDLSASTSSQTCMQQVGQNFEALTIPEQHPNRFGKE
ncbi:hypothetical protein O6H91_03G005000 [Diphasiastrum complanatum]|uniref:Uncharacterized protein n=1 Tax=Diphasiastrum complanatum TaxID=34168 RepID=A0ACC2E321_DIPCM|nr:hypothetical protein O6H91_Y402400 [Diphasiastrum complanatum]KAJ7560895.1 hypothetical protein O6H91_03G005000 [Diphasiastrum complanatum]